ncbi:hypothetical protein [Oceanobacillus salinisoli]|uniref:hypothetical protein n=1 Tax=Oceanobacillus salinisoli TaxID=2678611 RepID=UPI0012E25021|nr:hypothetical protein [Oceanobacillus salinisoli]
MKNCLYMVILSLLIVFVSGCEEREGSNAEHETLDREQNRMKDSRKTVAVGNPGAEEELSDEAQEAIQVVHDNIKFSEEEDLKGYVDTVSSEIKEEIQMLAADIFQNYDIENEILSTKVMEENEDTIVLQVEQKSVATYISEGNEFEDNISIVQHVLNREVGEWKIASSGLVDRRLVE